MARFQFRLQSLLTYRESLRDQCRQVLAQWLARDAALIAEDLARTPLAREFGENVVVDEVAVVVHLSACR